jgi:hypothetical protein
VTRLRPNLEQVLLPGTATRHVWAHAGTTHDLYVLPDTVPRYSDRLATGLLFVL